MNWADLYGGSMGRTVNEATSPDASGPPGSVASPAFSWVALLLVLVGIRLLWEYAE